MFPLCLSLGWELAVVVEITLMNGDKPRDSVSRRRIVVNCWLNAGGSSAEYTTAHATTGDDSNSRTTNDVESSRTVHDDKNWSRFRRVARSLVGTPNYIAPEVLSQSGDLSLLLLRSLQRAAC